MTTQDRIDKIRDDVHSILEELDERGAQVTQYDGHMTFGVEYSRKNPIVYFATMDISIGPQDHYQWTADSMAAVLNKVEADINKWGKKIDLWIKKRQEKRHPLEDDT